MRNQTCPDGGIGRRAGLKHQWIHFHPGSTPGLGTEAEKVEELSPLFFSTPLTYWDQRKRGQSEKDIFGAPGKHRKFRIGSGGIGETQKQDCQNHKSTVG